MKRLLSISLLCYTLKWITACTINIHYPVPAALPELYLQQSPEAILGMVTSGGSGDHSYAVGEEIQLNVQTSVDAYAHCYYQQADGQIVQVFPNPHMPQQLLKAGQQLRIPDSDRFQILADTPGRTEAFMCLASCDEMSDQLPGVLRVEGFEPLDVNDFDEMYDLYRKSTTSSLVGRVITVRIN